MQNCCGTIPELWKEQREVLDKQITSIFKMFSGDQVNTTGCFLLDHSQSEGRPLECSQDTFKLVLKYTFRYRIR